MLEAKDLMCFPWAVVEIKRGTAFHVQEDNTYDEQHGAADDERQGTALDEQKAKEAEAKEHEKRKQFCYCQAANASAAGLTLREDLAARANDSSKLGDARVMFSFTCVGSAVKLWITYRKPVCPIILSK
jgi:hypothetical protein